MNIQKSFVFVFVGDEERLMVFHIEDVSRKLFNETVTVPRTGLGESGVLPPG